MDCSTNENSLRDHSARVRLTRGGRQLRHLLGALTPETHAAIGDLPPCERRDAAERFDTLHRAVEAFTVSTERLIDASPLVNEPQGFDAWPGNVTADPVIDPLAMAMETEVEPFSPETLASERETKLRAAANYLDRQGATVAVPFNVLMAFDGIAGHYFHQAESDYDARPDGDDGSGHIFRDLDTAMAWLNMQPHRLPQPQAEVRS